MDFICLPILLFTGLMLITILTGFLTGRLGMPLILLFILIGLVLGSPMSPFREIGLLSAEHVFFIGSVALALILFDSGFNTRFSHFKMVAKPAILLASVGVFISTLILTPVVMVLLNCTFIQGLLLSSIIGSTDAAAVFFLLRSRGLFLKNKVKSTLEVESGSNDPMAIFLTLTCLTVLAFPAQTNEQNFLFFLNMLLKQLTIGILGGCMLFVILKYSLKRIELEQALFPLFVLSVVMGGFAVITLLNGSGYLAVYLCGLLIGNTPIKSYTTLLKFQQTITWLSQIIMFTALGLFASPEQLSTLFAEALFISIALMLVARPIMVFCLLHFFKIYSRMEKIFISFVGLRGATSVLLALAPIVFNMPFGETFFNIIFIMVLLSLSIQGFLIPLVARYCQVVATHKTMLPERTSVDLPGLIQSNLIVYELGENSAVLSGQRWPQWAQPLLLKRNNVVYQSNNIPSLKQKDYVYVFAPNEHRITLLDRLYGNVKESHKPKVFGDFPIKPTATFLELKKNYGIEIDPCLKNVTLGEYIQSEFPEADIGDRFTFDTVEIVIRMKKAGKIVGFGIDIDPQHPQHEISQNSLKKNK